jgi:hypothetical protein
MTLHWPGKRPARGIRCHSRKEAYMKVMTRLAFLSALLFGAGLAFAHHSFVVFFDPDRSVTITGKVTEFQFRNPHGEITLDVKTDKGQSEVWQVETNSPGVLRRRGWSNDSLKVGDTVTIQGWPSRDGKRYMRLLKATRADGSLIGVPFDPSKE